MNEILEDGVLDESKIKVLVDYSPIVKSISLKGNKTKFGIVYNAVATLIDGNEVETRCKDKLVKAIKVLESYGKTAVLKKELLKESSERNDKTSAYNCIKITLTNGQPYRYFIDNSDDIIISTVYENYMEKNKKKESK